MDKRLIVAVFIIGLLTGVIFTITYYRASTPEVQVFFSPEGGCEQVVLHYISNAKRSIHVLMFSFTLNSFADALITAHGRGVEVKVVFETEQELNYDVFWSLKDAGVEVRNDTNTSFMHNKIAIIDGEIVLTGSYNWSNSAEHVNDENLLVIRNKELAGKYEIEFQSIWIQSIG